MNINSLILGLLGVLFVALKLTGYIAWSWWLVLLPFYFGLAFCSVMVLMGFAFVGVISLVDVWKRR